MNKPRKIIPHTLGHKTAWLTMGRPRKYPKGHPKNPFGNKGLHFRCYVRNCEVNHGFYDCPICKSKGKKRVMDESEKKDGICGDCGLHRAFTSGKLGNGLLVER